MKPRSGARSSGPRASRWTSNIRPLRAAQRDAHVLLPEQHRHRLLASARPRASRAAGSGGPGRLRAHRCACARRDKRCAGQFRRRPRRADAHLSVRRARLPAKGKPGDEVLTGATDGPYVCALFKSQRGTETTGWLPRTALEVVSPQAAPARQWDGTWRRDRDARITIKSDDDEVSVSGDAVWGSHDPQRVRRGGIHVGVLNGKGRPRGRTLAIGYDPDRSGFPPAPDETPDDAPQSSSCWAAI